jgi:hypothetical protein
MERYLAQTRKKRACSGPEIGERGCNELRGV